MNSTDVAHCVTVQRALVILVRMLIFRVVRFRVKSRNVCLAKLNTKNAGKIKLFNVVKTENNRKKVHRIQTA